MTRARREQVSLLDTPYYHCISRCVRRKKRRKKRDIHHSRYFRHPIDTDLTPPKEQAPLPTDNRINAGINQI